MKKVWFRCDGKNSDMFILNTSRDLSYIPSVGDFVEPKKGDFKYATFRVKPYLKDKDNLIRDEVCLTFKVVSRTYSLRFDEWELICEPTPKSLLYLLKSIKIK